jgi:hypothetical protein
VAETFPFRIHSVRTDSGHEWGTRFHWYVEDKGIQRQTETFSPEQMAQIKKHSRIINVTDYYKKRAALLKQFGDSLL